MIGIEQEIIKAIIDLLRDGGKYATIGLFAWFVYQLLRLIILGGFAWKIFKVLSEAVLTGASIRLLRKQETVILASNKLSKEFSEVLDGFKRDMTEIAKEVTESEKKD